MILDDLLFIQYARPFLCLCRILLLFDTILNINSNQGLSYGVLHPSVLRVLRLNEALDLVVLHLILVLVVGEEAESIHALLEFQVLAVLVVLLLELAVFQERFLGEIEPVQIEIIAMILRPTFIEFVPPVVILLPDR